MNTDSPILFNPQALLDELLEIKAQNAQILSLLNAKKYVTMQEIAEAQGVGIQRLRVEPWRMPNFGRADEGVRPKKWYIATYQRWISESMENHKARWFAMSPEERKEALGIEDAA